MRKLLEAKSQKQRDIMRYLEENAHQITLDEAVKLVGKDIYRNEHKHVGQILSRMVNRGLIRRIKAGVFTDLPEV